MFRTDRGAALRTLLLCDAGSCAVMGLMLSLGSAPLAGITGLPAKLLLFAGLALLPIAAFVLLVALRPSIPASGVILIVAGNAGWAAGSLILLGSRWIAPNGLGIGFVLAQALVVAVLAVLEYLARPGTSAGWQGVEVRS